MHIRKIPRKKRRAKRKKEGKKAKVNPEKIFCEVFEIESLPKYYKDKNIINAYWVLSRTQGVEREHIKILIQKCSRLLNTPESIHALAEAFRKYFSKDVIAWFVYVGLPIFGKSKITSNNIPNLLLLISRIKRVCEERKITPTPILKELAKCENFEEMRKLALKFLQSKFS